MLEITDVAELTECHHHSGSAPWPTRATSTISPWAHCGFTAVPKTGVRSVTVPLWEQLWGLLETPPPIPLPPHGAELGCRPVGCPGQATNTLLMARVGGNSTNILCEGFKSPQ